jgi:hypothetical protein
VTGEFHNLTSSGTFSLPGNDTRSSGPGGAVQLSDGNGGFNNDGQLYVQNGLVLDNSGIGAQKPFVLSLKTDANQNYPGGVGSGNPGDVFYGEIGGTATFWGYKGNSWFDLTAGGGGGGAVAVNPPERSLQFANIAANQLSSSSLARFWLKDDVPLPGLTLPYNVFTVGNIFQSVAPTVSTFFAYSSDANNKTFAQFDEPTGINFSLNDTAATAGNGEFRVETAEIGVPAIGEDKIILQTRDGNTNIKTFRRTNGPEYGQGSINLLTNTGGITLQSRGENSGGGTATGVNGGDITLDSQDGNIFLTSITKSITERQIKLNSNGSYGNTFTNESILLETTKLSPNPSLFSGNIVAKTEGGRINLKTTIGTSTGDGGVFLSTEEGNIDINAGGVALVPFSSTGKILNLSAVNGVKANTKFSVTTGVGVPIWEDNITLDGPSGVLSVGDANGINGNIQVKNSTNVKTIDLDGSSDGIVTVGTTTAGSFGGNIKAINTKSGTGPAGYAVRIGSDATNESGRIQLSDTTDQVTIDINGGDGIGNNQPYIRLTDFIGTASGKELQLRSLQQNRPCIEGSTSQGGANTMIIESNGGGSTGAAEHGQMIFSSAGNISGSIPVMKIERSDVSNDSTPTLQLQRPLRLWNAATANITNVTTGLTKVGDMAYDTTTDCVKYRSNNGSILCLASGDQRILRVVQGSESLAKNYNASGTGATSWTGNPAPVYGGTGIGSVPLGPAGPPSIVGTIRSGTTFTNASAVAPIGPAIQSAPGLGSEDCNIIYLGTGSGGAIIPADGTPNFRPVLCCKCLVPERVSANPADLEYSLLVSGNLNIWAKLSSSQTGSDKINFSLGVFATLADSIGMPNGGAGNGISDSEKRNNPYTGVPNPGGAAGTAYNADYVSSLAGSGTVTTINGTGGGTGGLGTWPRPLHSSYYTNLTQTGNNNNQTGFGNSYRYASVGTFKSGTWTDPLGFLPGTPSTGGGWGDALKGDPYQDTPSPAQNGSSVREGSGTMSIPFSLLCNNPNLDLNGGTWSKGPEREIYLWLCLGFNGGGNWDWLQVSKNGFGNYDTSTSFSNPPFFGANSMKVTYLGTAAAALNGASSDA